MSDAFRHTNGLSVRDQTLRVPKDGDMARLWRAIEFSIHPVFGGITIHDDMGDGSIVVEQNGEVLGRGNTVAAALDDFIRKVEKDVESIRKVLSDSHTT
jgi:hypothetical protein